VRLQTSSLYRRSAKYLILLFFAVGLLGNPLPVPAHSLAQADTVFALVNQLRVANGFVPFTYNALLAAAAQNHAVWMAETNTINHTESNGSVPQDRANAVGYIGRVSENIVGGTQLSPQGGVTWWQNSAVHLQTMLSSFYPEAGVGFAQGDGWNYYVLVVGRPGGYSGSLRVEQPTGDDTRTAQQEQAPLAVVAPIVTSTPNPDGSIVHIVQPGHTFWAISARYAIPLIDLLRQNKLTENSTLRPGDKLIIRFADDYKPPPTPTPPLTHTIQKGETAWTIAVRYQIPLADLFLYNQLNEHSVLYPGSTLKVRLAPGELPPPTATPFTFHAIQSGQTYWTVAAIYGLTLQQLLDLNQLDVNSIPQPGDLLRIRPLEAATTPTATTEITTPTLLAVTAMPTPAGAPQPHPIALATNTPATAQAFTAEPDAAPPTSSAQLYLAIAGGAFCAAAILLAVLLWQNRQA
jgi:uncharacterized protein YkwD/LysM repeat protein